MSKQGKLLLFDVDGVIVDSLEHIYEGAISFVKAHGGKEITVDQYRDAFKKNVIEEMFKLAGLDSKQVKITGDDMKLFFESYHKTTLFNEMKEVLEELAKDNTMVTITSSLIDAVSHKFEEEGIIDLFAAFLGPKASAYKDEKIKMALKEFGYDKSNAVFISDTSGDIVEAKKVGVTTIGTTWGVHDRETLEEVNPDHIADSPQELLNTLKNI